MFGWTKTVAGLDIGSSAVKAVELKATGRSLRVSAVGIAALPPDAIVDGAIIDASAVAGAIRQAFLSHPGFKAREVCASLSGNAVIVKKLSLPVMTEGELSNAIPWEAEQHIPFDVQDVNLDYQVLDAGTGPGGSGTMEVLLVAAKKDKIGDYTSVIAQAGRTPVILDVDAFAVQNAYEANYGSEPAALVVLLNAGASSINVNVLQGGRTIFTRDISMGGRAYTEALQQELGLPWESAEQLKKGLAVDGATFEDAVPILQAVTENLLLEIQKTFDFFKATAESDHLDRIVVSGGASRIDGFLEALEDRFGVAVERLDPFRHIACDLGVIGEQAPDVAASAVVALGLALRRAGDR